MLARSSFIFGLLSFLIAHIYFIKQFWAKPISNIVNSMLSIVIICAITVMLFFTGHGTRSFNHTCYMLVISIMAIKACLAENSSLLLKVGVLSFLCSVIF